MDASYYEIHTKFLDKVNSLINKESTVLERINFVNNLSGADFNCLKCQSLVGDILPDNYFVKGPVHFKPFQFDSFFSSVDFIFSFKDLQTCSFNFLRFEEEIVISSPPIEAFSSAANKDLYDLRYRDFLESSESSYDETMRKVSLTYFNMKQDEEIQAQLRAEIDLKHKKELELRMSYLDAFKERQKKKESLPTTGRVLSRVQQAMLRVQQNKERFLKNNTNKNIQNDVSRGEKESNLEQKIENVQLVRNSGLFDFF